MDFVRAGVGQPRIWQALQGQIYLGGEGFAERMQRLIEDEGGALSEIPRAQRRPQPKAIAHYQRSHADRDEAMAQAYLTGDYTLKSIAEHFGVHYATVSRAVRKYEQDRSSAK